MTCFFPFACQDEALELQREEIRVLIKWGNEKRLKDFIFVKEGGSHCYVYNTRVNWRMHLTIADNINQIISEDEICLLKEPREDFSLIFKKHSHFHCSPRCHLSRGSSLTAGHISIRVEVEEVKHDMISPNNPCKSA